MNALNILSKALTITIILAASAGVSGRTIYVDVNATGADNGLTWPDAFTDLSIALSSAEAGDVVWVAEGVYIPSIEVDVEGDGSNESRDKTFLVPDGVKVYGGFQSGDLLLTDRNWTDNKTILSGDIDQNDINTDLNFIAESSSDIRGANSYHVVLSIEANMSLDGLIITAGVAENFGLFYPPRVYGGGLYLESYNELEYVVNVTNCTFQGNHAWYGGAIAARGTATRINNCRFYNNDAYLAGGAINGRRLNINESEFVRNMSRGSGGAVSAGSSSFIRATQFRQNHSMTQGGAVEAIGCSFEDCNFLENFVSEPIRMGASGNGGAVMILHGEVNFLNCGFYFNKSRHGGGVCQVNTTDSNPPRYINCAFGYNYAESDGGAIANYSTARTSFLTNCTLIDNEAGNRGGAIYNHKGIFAYEGHGSNDANFDSKSKFENCILWNNSASEGDEIFSRNASSNNISYSIVDLHGRPWDRSLGIDGGNNIFTDPALHNPADPWGEDGIHGTTDDGLRLSARSPAVNTGNDGATHLAGISADIKGEQRFRFTVDRGAYEYNPFRMPQRLTPGPPCPKCWTIKLPALKGSFIWETQGFMSQSHDGEPTLLSGKIYEENDPSIGFEVYLKLKNPQDWNQWAAQDRTYVTYTSEAEDVAGRTKTSWIFWELDAESYLKGIGDIKGTLWLKHAPGTFKEGFQFGAGANGWDSDQGIGGSFYYEGTLTHAGKSRTFSDIGTLTVDTEICEHCSSEIITPANHDAGNRQSSVLVFPNPITTELTILSESIPTDQYSFFLYDENANLKRELKIDTAQGNVTIALDELNPGMYTVQLRASNGKSYHTKIIVK